MLAGLACASAAAQRAPLAVGRPHELWTRTPPAADASAFRDSTASSELRPVSFAGPDARESVVTSETLELEPFDECLFSWNALHARATGFGVEISVARTVDGTFSPWMWIGEWNVSARPAELVLEHEDARIDVDTFASRSTWRALRWRIRVRGDAAEPAGFALERFSAMPTLRGARGRWGAPAAAVARLEVPFRSQRAESAELASRICSPTSLAMVLAFRGVDVPTAEVARRAYDPFHDIYGNWNRAIQAAHSLGVPGRLERIGGWARAEELLRAGQPLVASIAAKSGELHGAPYASTSGHLLVICGFDARGDVLVNDPAALDASAGRATYARAELEQVWLARGGTAYVLEAPRNGAH